MKKGTFALLGAAFFASAGASAHIGLSAANGNGLASSSNELTFSIGHGCPKDGGGGDADTIKVEIDIPADVTDVKAMPNAFGKATVTPTKVTFEKAPADYLAEDSGFYKLTIRVRVPNAPFTKIYFPAHQYCNGVANPVHWTTTPSDDGGAGTAPTLVVMPAKQPGWNRYTVPVAITDMPSFFKDAQIVWKGNAAYSANAVTLDQIKSEAGVTELTSLAASDEIWVKY